MKKNQETQPTVSSSEETDSDASSSRSEGEGLPSAPPPSSTADKKSAALKKPTEPAADKTRDSDSDDSESDSLIASKPMDDGTKLKKPRLKPNSKPSNPAASPTNTPAKRGLALDGESSKRPLKKDKGEGWGAEEEGKKSGLFQRLWNDDDEILVLKGMIEYKEKKGADPMMDSSGFHDFIKKSLHVEVDRKQVVDKVRRLKKRCGNMMLKKNLTSHERNTLELSKKIWVYDTDGAEHMKTRTVSKAAASKGVGTSARNGGDVVTSNGAKDVENNDSGMDKEGSSSWQFIGKSSISMGLDENVAKVGLELCSEDKKAEMEDKWKELYLEESDLFLRKLDLARQEGKMIIEALKSVGK